MTDEDTDGVIPESKIREAHAKCMEDPELAKYFNDAPQGAKEYIALMFYCTVFQNEVDDGLYETYQKEVEEELTREDMLYLATHDRNPQTKAHFRDLLAQVPPTAADASPAVAPASEAVSAPTTPIVFDTRRLEMAIDRIHASLQKLDQRLEEQERQAARFRRFRFACLVIWLVFLFVAVVGAVVLTLCIMP